MTELAVQQVQVAIRTNEVFDFRNKTAKIPEAFRSGGSACDMEKVLNHAEYLGRWTLILGDVNSGKTSLCRAILEEMCRHRLAERTVIIDLAPEVPDRVLLNGGLKGVGGRLLPPRGEKVVYLSAPLVAPRLSSACEKEAFEKARLNVPKIEALFRQYSRLKRDILFINDISMSVQVDSAEKMIGFLLAARTVVANGYYGTKLTSGELSRRERRQMDMLKKFFHEIISM
jgi:hypothetical protein